MITPALIRIEERIRQARQSEIEKSVWDKRMKEVPGQVILQISLYAQANQLMQVNELMKRFLP